eukprot:s171_g14.t1
MSRKPQASAAAHSFTRLHGRNASHPAKAMARHLCRNRIDRINRIYLWCLCIPLCRICIAIRSDISDTLETDEAADKFDLHRRMGLNASGLERFKANLTVHQEEVDDLPGEGKGPKTEQASSAASSSSVGVSQVPRAVQDLELRSHKASEERSRERDREGRKEARDYQREELEDRESNWSETASSSSTSWSRSTWSSNWGSDQSRA